MRADYAGVGLRWAAVTDVGRVRKLNEDALLAQPPVFAVADGMGGHEAGEIASAMTIQRLTDLAGGEPPNIDGVAAEFQSIHETLRHASVGGRSVDMGTTAVALMVVRQGGVLSWLVVNIGDSRMYSLADGVMEQVTNDHSYVQELVDAGEIEASEMRTHPQKNIVTQALGAIEIAKPDFWVRQLRSRERFLLCSDGLTGEVEDDEIAAVLDSVDSPDEAVAILTSRALEHGGRDNVTIVVVDVESVPVDLAEGTDTSPPPRPRVASLTAVPGIAPPPDGKTVLDEPPMYGPATIGEVPCGAVQDLSVGPASGPAAGGSLIDLVPGADLQSEPEVTVSFVAVSVIERMPEALLPADTGLGSVSDDGSDGDD